MFPKSESGVLRKKRSYTLRSKIKLIGIAYLFVKKLRLLKWGRIPLEILIISNVIIRSSEKKILGVSKNENPKGNTKNGRRKRRKKMIIEDTASII